MLFTAESFSLSSNIIVDTATFHLRYSLSVSCSSSVTDVIFDSVFTQVHSSISCKFATCFVVVRFILDDSALYLSDKCEAETVDLRRGENSHSCHVDLCYFLKR